MAQIAAFAVDVLRLALWLAILAAIFVPLERLFGPKPAGRTRRELAVDLAYYFLNGLAPALLMALPLAALAALARAATPESYLAWLSDTPVLARIAAALIVAEFAAYWGHRLCHEVPWLWRFHVVHHAPEKVDWLINTRAHPIDIAFTRLCGLAPLYLLGLAEPQASGAEAMIPVYVVLVGTVWSFFVHADVRWRFGALERLVATPAFHHWHHTNDEHRDRNYAALFPWIDALFGTLHLPEAYPTVYGVDSPPPKGLVPELLHPFAAEPGPAAQGAREAA